MTRSSSDRILVWAWGVFILGFAFAMFLLQNLPFTFGDDLNNIHLVKNTPWPVLLSALANPLTPAWYVHGIESLLTTRAFFSVLFKILYSVFGYSENAFWALKAVGYAGVGALIFLFVQAVTQRKWMGVLASLFYFMLPPVYRTVSWISDIEIVAEMFILFSFWCFLSLYKTSDSTPSPLPLPLKGGEGKGEGGILLLLASAYLGMKLRETARMVPFILLGFILLRQNRNLIQWFRANSRNKILLAASLLLFIPVIPLGKPVAGEFDTRSHTAIFQIDPGNFLLILAPLIKIMLVVLIAVALIFVLSRLTKPGIEDERLGRPPSSVFLFFSLWSGFCILAFALNFRIQDNIRYLTTPLIPLTILGFSLYGRMAPIFKKPLFRYLTHGAFIALILFSLQENWGEIKFVRNHFGGVEIADYKLTKKIGEDYYRDPDITWQELDDFHRGKGRTIPESREIKIKAWDENAKERLNPEYLKKIASKWGAAYILVFENLPDEAKSLLDDSNFKLIYESTTSNDSIYNLVFRKKKKANRPIYLYKYT